jgi:hypothetical protein
MPARRLPATLRGASPGREEQREPLSANQHGRPPHGQASIIATNRRRAPMATAAACDGPSPLGPLMELHFSQHFNVPSELLESYGAFDISVISDLPLFIDPFLLFNSNKSEYQELHESILTYLRFFRDKATEGELDESLITSWYRFKEVKQNWLGFTVLGNDGHGLGRDFAKALHEALGTVLSDFGSERITRSSHLEKACLLRPKVGRDSISDFTTNLIKEYLLSYTQEFAKYHLRPEQCRAFRVPKVRFNYETESWEEDTFYLPALGKDFVLLTPEDILTRDDTWISNTDLIQSFHCIPEALPDAELRAQVNNYFRNHLARNPSKRDRDLAAQATLRAFPELLDYYIRMKEDSGDTAESVSKEKVRDTRHVFVEQLQALVADLSTRTDFYSRGRSSYKEVLERVHAFKHYVEHQDGYKLINRAGRPFAQESEVHIYFGLMWFGSLFDVNREPNNGRGPVDFKVSFGAGDKALIEFKLASNTQLERNLKNQVAIYEKANRTRQSVKVIICYTAADQRRVARILRKLRLSEEASIVVIDARSDNKPSASKA